MSSQNTPKAKLTTVACFSTKYFPENLAVRSDGSILVTAFNHNEPWYVPPSGTHVPVDPVLMHTFALPPLNMVEVEPDIF